MIALKYIKLKEDAAVPERATEGAAGYDLRACLDKPVTIEPGGREMIQTGIAAAIPGGHAGLVFGRSGLAFRHGVSPANGVGVIDSDYRGEIHAALANRSDTAYTVQSGDRIAQLLIVPAAEVNFELAEDLPETGRGTKGFGSTGR